MEKVKKQYGLPTGIAMVVGIVIGSGVFLKAGGVLKLSGGDLKLSLLAWLVGGLIMVVSGFCFAVFANKVERFNGVVDYVELSSNKRVAYHLAWLMTTLYYPTVASIVSVFASAYFLEVTGIVTGVTVIYQLLSMWQTYLVAFILLTLFALINYFSPRIAGKFQVTSTVVKLIPILVISIAGLIIGIFNDTIGTINAFNQPGTIDGMTTSFGDAVKKTSFAYEGWVCATIINAELKDSKKNLPRALVGGTIVIVLFYILYYVGVSSLLGNTNAMILDANAPLVIFETVFNFGKIGHIIISLLIMMSCLGTVNGVTMSCLRGMYTMSCRGLGPAPEKVSKLDPKSGMSKISCIIGYFCMIFMLLLWYLANNEIWYFKYLGSMDEIVCAFIYGTFIIMYIYMIRNFKDLNIFKRFVMPIIAIIGCTFFILCGTGLYQLMTGSTDAIKAFGVWMILFVIMEIPSFFFFKKDAKGVIDQE